MTLAPRSLKLPVGANHSSLKCAGAPSPRPLDKRRAAFAHRDRILHRDGKGGAIAPQRAFAPVDIVAADARQRRDHQRRAIFRAPARLVQRIERAVARVDIGRGLRAHFVIQRR